MIHNNKDIDELWRIKWDLKEKALKQSYLKGVEKLGSHTRLQKPLNIGDKVLIQNQAGRYANKWDKSGSIVEIHPYDQYTVKVDGSGRLTLRNRQFLRKAITHDLFSSHPTSVPKETDNWVQKDTQQMMDRSQESELDERQPVEIVPSPSSVPCDLLADHQADPSIDESHKGIPQRSDEEPDMSTTPVRPKLTQLERELKRIGGYNKPGQMESPLPTSRTRSGKV